MKKPIISCDEMNIIKKIDSINKLIYLNNLKLLFNQIIDVNSFYDGNCSLE